jgi:hypothetical protein
MVVIIDIDNTLSDSTWREELIKEQGWDAFHAAGKDDEPIKAMVKLISALCDSSQITEIVALTARPEKWRAQTMLWLVTNEIYVDELIMRPDNDFAPSRTLKVKLAKEQMADRWDQVGLIIDDREDVITAFRAEGKTCLQVMK